MEEKMLLEAIGQMMDEKLKPIQMDMMQIKADIATIKDDLAELKEAHEITREGVNKVVEWADNAGFLLKIPFGQPGK